MPTIDLTSDLTRFESSPRQESANVANQSATMANGNQSEEVSVFGEKRAHHNNNNNNNNSVSLLETTIVNDRFNTYEVTVIF